MSLREVPTGHFTTEPGDLREYEVFHPTRVPPVPPVQLSDSQLAQVTRANRALARLDATSLHHAFLNTGFLVDGFVRAEAVLSSKIEGTKSTLEDLVHFEHQLPTTVPAADVREVQNYVDALEYGFQTLSSGALPLSLRLVKQAHRLLLQGVRGDDRQPGRFRRSQVQIGGGTPETATFVPPPHTEIVNALKTLERYWHESENVTDPIVKAGIAHAHFESIHPFLDGNGRVGRLLIVLMLINDGLLSSPLLVPSLEMARDRQRYYAMLNGAHNGSWAPWLEYFAECIETSALAATETIEKMLKQFNSDLQMLKVRTKSDVAREVLYLAARHLVIEPSVVARDLGVSHQAVNKVIKLLVEIGVLLEISGRSRGRKFAYSEMIAVSYDAVR